MILYESIMNFYVMKLIWTILNEFCIQIEYSKIVTIRSIISEIGSLRAMQPIGSGCEVCGEQCNFKKSAEIEHTTTHMHKSSSANKVKSSWHGQI